MFLLKLKTTFTHFLFCPTKYPTLIIADFLFAVVAVLDILK